MVTLKFAVIVEKDGEGCYVTSVLELPGWTVERTQPKEGVELVGYLQEKF